MRISEMEVRLEAGEKAIDLSIEKWQNIIDDEGEDDRCNNCALCKEYLADGNECAECPLVLYSEIYECDGYESPYREYKDTGDAAIMRDALIETKQWMIDTGRYKVME